MMKKMSIVLCCFANFSSPRYEKRDADVNRIACIDLDEIFVSEMNDQISCMPCLFSL